MVAVGSQIGHLFLYDLEQKRLVLCEKVHLGGIEGLAMFGRTIFTCSSDNTVIISKFSGNVLNAKSDLDEIKEAAEQGMEVQYEGFQKL